MAACSSAEAACACGRPWKVMTITTTTTVEGKRVRVGVAAAVDGGDWEGESVETAVAALEVVKEALLLGEPVPVRDTDGAIVCVLVVVDVDDVVAAGDCVPEADPVRDAVAVAVGDVDGVAVPDRVAV